MVKAGQNEKQVSLVNSFLMYIVRNHFNQAHESD